jgi:23S rRNA pseudouridine2605 synthase
MTAERARAGRRVQLHRALSKLGWGSRTQAWQWIRQGHVRVDGRVVTDPLVWVDLEHQRITRGGQAAPDRRVVVLALHKPRGVITTRSDERGRRTVYDLLPPALPWLFPAGRLDAASEGLLILTNDSALAVRLSDPAHHVPKTYHVTLDDVPSEADLRRLRRGVDLAEGRTRPAEVRRLGPAGSRELEIVLTEGRNRQVRRMAVAVGRKVRRLVRIRIGGLVLGDLPPGACRVLNSAEQSLLLQTDRGSGSRS